MSPKIALDLAFFTNRCYLCEYKEENFCTLFRKGVVGDYRVDSCIQAEALHNMLTVKFSDAYRD